MNGNWVNQSKKWLNCMIFGLILNNWRLFWPIFTSGRVITCQARSYLVQKCDYQRYIAYLYLLEGTWINQSKQKMNFRVLGLIFHNSRLFGPNFSFWNMSQPIKYCAEMRFLTIYNDSYPLKGTCVNQSKQCLGCRDFRLIFYNSRLFLPHFSFEKAPNMLKSITYCAQMWFSTICNELDPLERSWVNQMAVLSRN